MYSPYIITIIFIYFFIVLINIESTDRKRHGFEKIQNNFMFILFITTFISIPIIVAETVVTTVYNLT